MLIPIFYLLFFLHCVKIPTNNGGNLGKLEFLCTLCSKEQTSKQNKAKHGKRNGCQIVTLKSTNHTELSCIKGCRFPIQSYKKYLKNLLFGVKVLNFSRGFSFKFFCIYIILLFV